MLAWLIKSTVYYPRPSSSLLHCAIPSTSITPLPHPAHTTSTLPPHFPPHPGTDIAGTSDGLSRVLYTNGTCSVDPDTAFGFFEPVANPCRLASARKLRAPPAPSFVCGLRVSGQSLCGGGWGLV